MCELPEFREHPERQVRIDSALTLLRVILSLEDLYPVHKKEYLSTGIKKITEANDKYNLQYWSQDAIKRWQQNRKRNIRKPYIGLHHEHVYEIRYLIDQLKQNKENINAVLPIMIACVVTIEQHKQLPHNQPNLIGWDRYQEANITVVDLVNGDQLDL